MAGRTNVCSQIVYSYFVCILANLTNNILLFMTKVNVDFIIEGMKCHKDDKHDVRGPDTEVNKHF